MHTNHSRNFQYHLFSLSNLLAAFGGGMILGKGISILDIPYFHANSLMAFFIGGVLGLVFLQVISSHLSDQLAKIFAMAGGAISIILFLIFNAHSLNGKLSNIYALLFFILLCVRFSFWFYSRVMRAANVAGQQQKIAWVELGYYAGIILGLIIWKFLGVDFGISAALLIDASLQFLSGFIDFYAYYIVKIFPQDVKESNNPTVAEKLQKQLFEKIKHTNPIREILPISSRRLLFAVVCLTVGVQVVLFSLTYFTSENLNSFIIASFYFGAAVAAFMCKKFNIQMLWKINSNKKYKSPTISYQLLNGRKDINIIAMALVSIFCVYVTVYASTCASAFSCAPTYSLISTINKYVNFSFLGINHSGILVFFFAFISAFFYEIYALGILDAIGYSDRHKNEKMVIKTYGVMGVAAAIFLALFEVFLKTSAYLPFISIFAIAITTVSLLKRDVI